MRLTKKPKVAELELLVDELIKEAPHEPTIRARMQDAGLDYVADPIARMNMVLAELGRISKMRARQPERSRDA